MILRLTSAIRTPTDGALSGFGHEPGSNTDWQADSLRRVECNQATTENGRIAPTPNNNQSESPLGFKLIYKTMVSAVKLYIFSN